MWNCEHLPAEPLFILHPFLSKDLVNGVGVFFGSISESVVSYVEIFAGSTSNRNIFVGLFQGIGQTIWGSK